ncbi:hypothetical protein D3C75_701930 [compost metagenome]
MLLGGQVHSGGCGNIVPFEYKGQNLVAFCFGFHGIRQQNRHYGPGSAFRCTPGNPILLRRVLGPVGVRDCLLRPVIVYASVYRIIGSAVGIALVQLQGSAFNRVGNAGQIEFHHKLPVGPQNQCAAW